MSTRRKWWTVWASALALNVVGGHMFVTYWCLMDQWPFVVFMDWMEGLIPVITIGCEG